MTTKAELVSLEIVENSSVSDSEFVTVCAKGEIRFNNQNQLINVQRTINCKKKIYKIKISEGKLNEEALNTIGVHIDKDEIAKTFEKVLKKERMLREEKIKKEKEKFYDQHPIHIMMTKIEESTDREIVEMETTITSKEDALLSTTVYPYIVIRMKQHYRTKDEHPNIVVSIKYNAGKYELEKNYKTLKKSKYVKDVYTALLSTIRGAMYDIDLVIKRKNERLETRNRLRKIISSELEIIKRTEFSGNPSNKRRHEIRELKIFKQVGTSDSKGVGITFNFPDDKNLMIIKKIQGKFTPEQVRRILDVVNEGKEEYTWNC